jgi:hypothetical protein
LFFDPLRRDGDDDATQPIAAEFGRHIA